MIWLKPRSASASVAFLHAGPLLSFGLLLEGPPKLPLSPLFCSILNMSHKELFRGCQNPPSLRFPKGVVATPASWRAH